MKRLSKPQIRPVPNGSLITESNEGLTQCDKVPVMAVACSLPAGFPAPPGDGLRASLKVKSAVATAVLAVGVAAPRRVPCRPGARGDGRVRVHTHMPGMG